MQCPNCKGIVPDSARFCGYCGHRFFSPPQPAPQPGAQPVSLPINPDAGQSPPAQKRKLPRWVWLLAILAVLIPCLIILLLWLRPRQGGGTQLPAVYENPPTASPTSAIVFEATMADCTLLNYEVQQKDTLDAIVAIFKIPAEKIMLYNNLSSDALSPGMILNLPLCEQLPVIGLTPTSILPGDQGSMSGTPTPDLTPTNEVIVGQPGDCNSFKLVQEEYPEGVVIWPGAAISKMWILKNNGTCTWTQDYSFIAVTDELMGGVSTWAFPQTFPPGSEYPLSMDFVSPIQEGSYVAGWSVRDDKGVEFGRIDFLVVVKNP